MYAPCKEGIKGIFNIIFIYGLFLEIKSLYKFEKYENEFESEEFIAKIWII